MGEHAFAWPLWAPRSKAPRCPVRALSPTAQRPLRGGFGRALKCAWRRAGCRPGVSAIGRCPVLRSTP
eukprot:10535946-Alexandrium_andersonii.AAC.1